MSKPITPTDSNCAAAADGAAIAPTANKVPAEVKTQPRSTVWEKYSLAQVLPKVFLWRDKQYTTENLTEIEIEALASDKEFKAIVRKAS